MFGQNREQLRQLFYQSWQKYQTKQSLNGIEAIIAAVVAQHPEYHTLLDNKNAIHHDFHIDDGQTNPFLHMGMHITLQEQLGSNRPAGIQSLHQQLSEQMGDQHQAEHQMMDCLGVALWQAQRNQQAPDEQAYLECVKTRLKKNP